VQTRHEDPVFLRTKGDIVNGFEEVSTPVSALKALGDDVLVAGQVGVAASTGVDLVCCEIDLVQQGLLVFCFFHEGRYEYPLLYGREAVLLQLSVYRKRRGGNGKKETKGKTQTDMDKRGKTLPHSQHRPIRINYSGTS
jgi:hypothetical protein